MRRNTIIAAMLLCMGQAVFLHAQDCDPAFRGTKTLYRPVDTAMVPPPEGYEPVFINFITRHGARHPTSLKELQRLQRVLLAADSGGALKEDGAKLLRMTERWMQTEAGYNQGTLSNQGKQELEGIGRRMARQYPAIQQSDSLFVRTTRQERTRQSAAAFFTGFGRPFPAGISPLLNDNDSIRLRFYDLAPAYLRFEKSGSWKARLERLERNSANTRCIRLIVQRWFSAGYAARLLQRNDGSGARDFVLAAFNTGIIDGAIEQEIRLAGYSPDSLRITGLFSCEELQRLEVLNDAEDFLVKGPGTNASGIQVKIAAPLLAGFIQTADGFLAHRKKGAVLRFAHAETVAPFAALCGIGHAATATTDIRHFGAVWKTSEVIPFASNIQWIFYRSEDRTKPDLVLFLMNEHPIRIPVATTRYPYYSWNAVRTFYLRRLHKMGVRPGMDMHQFLLKVAAGAQ